MKRNLSMAWADYAKSYDTMAQDLILAIWGMLRERTCATMEDSICGNIWRKYWANQMDKI